MTFQPLWSKKGLLTSEKISNFTVGEDPLIDPNFYRLIAGGRLRMFGNFITLDI